MSRGMILGLVLSLVSPAMAVDMEWVAVGEAGNAGDVRFADPQVPSFGGVGYTYDIGRYEVTAGQYVEFLNAVAATDTYGLYNPQMNSSEFGCQITQHGSSGSYTYDFAGRPSGTEADWSNRPVNYVSWGDAARFANWLHNGQPTGLQDAGSTETGSYDLYGATSDSDLLSVTRSTDATVVLPSEDEWYKAAYYDGAADVYFYFPTSSNGLPSNDLINPDPGNNATVWEAGYTIGSPYYRTEVGAHENSASPYGTFDQGGNVWEWNEAILNDLYRGMRGDSFVNSGFGSRTGAWDRNALLPSAEFYGTGFRVAAVPEPASLGLLALGGLALLRRRGGRIG